MTGWNMPPGCNTNDIPGNQKDEVYLGDGLYASFDGYAITLRAPRMEEDHWVSLEPAVYESLVEYAKTVWKLPQKDS